MITYGNYGKNKLHYSRSHTYSNEKGTYGYLQLNILNLIEEFYSIIALDIITNPIPFKHSHEKWAKDFNEYKISFFEIFSHMIYDYTVEAVMSELRHYHLSNFNICNLKNDMGRYEAFFASYDYTANSILRLGLKMFDENFNNWHGGYAGSGWYNISKAGLMYKKVPDSVFIDHCIDLSHNNGSYFDKDGFLFQIENEQKLKDFLNHKRYTKNPLTILVRMHSYRMYNLILRAKNLGILSELGNFIDCSYISSGICIDDPYEKLYTSSEIAYPFENMHQAFDEYSNHFYYEKDKRATGYNLWTIDNLLETYHPIIWGKKEIDNECLLLRNGNRYNEYGHNEIRDEREKEEEEKDENRKEKTCV